MPPKSKFTKKEVIAAALNIVENRGEEYLTARSLGAELGSSARPIFTVFDSMEEVQAEVVRAAKEIYAVGVKDGLKEVPAFKGVGKAYIKFAAEHPNLFRILFMKQADAVPDIKNVLGLIEDNFDIILLSIKQGYGLEDETAIKLYRHMWIYSHGIAALIATGVCAFTSEEISSMLTEVCSAMIVKYKSEGKS